MSANEPLTVETVREYLLKNNGKVRNHDLVTHFRTQLNDPVNKGQVRSDFKEIIHQVSTVQTIDGEKYFVLKKNSASNLPPIPLRKPTRNVTQRKERAISGPPQNFYPRHALNQNVPISQMDRSRSVGNTASEFVRGNSIPEEENDSARANISDLLRTVSSDSGIAENDSHSSGSETPKMSIRTKAAMFDRLSTSSLQSQSSITESLPSDADSGVPNEDLIEDDYLVGSTISLEPIEKDWMMACSICNKAAMMCLMEQDPNIVNRRDFSSGYSALHWAAKLGRNDIVTMLAGTGIDVNVRTNGGYTPLHLAVIHGREDVIHTLVDDFEADINMRDYSGKKPVQLLKKDISAYAIAKLQGKNNVPPPQTVDHISHHGSKKHGALNSIVLGAGLVSGASENGQKESSKEKKSSKKKSSKEKKNKKKERPQILHLSASEDREEVEMKTPRALVLQEEEMDNSCSDNDMQADEAETSLNQDGVFAQE